MITVPQAARLAGKDPETVRRWIRSGRLPATRVGTQYLIHPDDLQEMYTDRLPLPEAWKKTRTGEPMPDVVALIGRSRGSR